MNLKTKSGRRDFEGMEERRMKAAALFERGLWPSEIARRLGATRMSACRWHDAWRKQGAKALRAAGRAGRKPRLSESQIRKFEEGLKRGPEALGYATPCGPPDVLPIWFASRVASRFIRITFTAFSRGWGGAASVPPAGPSSATKTPSRHGSASAGRS